MSACTPDFNGSDFEQEDFQTHLTLMDFGNYLFDRFPEYFHREDTYKDSNNRGLLQRYMSIFGDEIDQEIIPEIECYLRIIDAQECEPQFLIHLSDVLGNPPDIFGNDNMYRNLLSYICSIYKIKGTKKAYQLFFSLLGFNIDLIEIPPVTNEYIHDNNGEYDADAILSLYDQDKCTPCSYYDITFYPKNQDSIVFNDLLIARLKEAIRFNEPINAKLRNLTLGISYNDSININLNDSASELNAQVNNYDLDRIYDDGDNYDDQGGIQVNYTQSSMDILVENLSTHIYNFYIKMPLQSLETLDLINTHIIVQAFDATGMIYEDVGFIVSYTYNNGFIDGVLIKYNHNIHTFNALKIYGNIKLTSGENANFNKFLVIGNNPIQLFFTL